MAVVEFAPSVANADYGTVHVQIVVPHRLDEGTVQKAGNPGFLKEGSAPKHGIHPVVPALLGLHRSLQSRFRPPDPAVSTASQAEPLAQAGQNRRMQVRDFLCTDRQH